MRPRHRQVPHEFVMLGQNVIEAREVWEDLQAKYRQMTIELAESIYLSALAEQSPFSYKTLRGWIVADAQLSKVPVIDDE